MFCIINFKNVFFKEFTRGDLVLVFYQAKFQQDEIYEVFYSVRT